MIDVHISVASIFAFLGIVIITGAIAWFLIMFDVLLHFDSQSRFPWLAPLLGAIEFFGGTWLLGWWAGLW